MKGWFSPKRREFVSGGLMRAFSLSFGAGLISEAAWKMPLRMKAAMGILMLATFILAWVTFPIDTAGSVKPDEKEL